MREDSFPWIADEVLWGDQKRRAFAVCERDALSGLGVDVELAGPDPHGAFAAARGANTRREDGLARRGLVGVEASAFCFRAGRRASNSSPPRSRTGACSRGTGAARCRSGAGRADASLAFLFDLVVAIFIHHALRAAGLAGRPHVPAPAHGADDPTRRWCKSGGSAPRRRMARRAAWGSFKGFMLRASSCPFPGKRTASMSWPDRKIRPPWRLS